MYILYGIFKCMHIRVYLNLNLIVSTNHSISVSRARNTRIIIFNAAHTFFGLCLRRRDIFSLAEVEISQCLSVSTSIRLTTNAPQPLDASAVTNHRSSSDQRTVSCCSHPNRWIFRSLHRETMYLRRLYSSRPVDPFWQCAARRRRCLWA